tara:strand:+ start:69 stop:320 length:252 start_codon:yes stop_codon:yes gene_type:complete
MAWTTATPGVTEYTQTAGMDGGVGTDNVAELTAQAAASAAAAGVSETGAAASLASINAKITVSTSAPVDGVGADGDIWFQYTV